MIGGGEEGLLGLAFHPEYGSNGYFYVDFTASNPPRTIVARYQVSSQNPDSANPQSGLVILEVSQPYDNHNGGQLAFGPDNYLYISFGDGGSGGDPEGNGQNLATLLGTIIRIDVDNPAQGNQYSIPSDNPFAGNTLGYREEIFAFGFRNPWRFSFDPVTNSIWTGDVGQNSYEEIDIVHSGHNYGWNIMEGFQCFATQNCDTTGLTMPVAEYTHSVGQSVTGGYVYRGAELSQLYGKYVFADYVSGRIWTLSSNPEGNVTGTLLRETDLNISSFGTDSNSELYLCAFDGYIYKFTNRATGVDERSGNRLMSSISLTSFPNPFNSQTTIRYTLSKDSRVMMRVFSLLGSQLTTLVDRKQPAGTHEVNWTIPDDLPAGPYYITLSIPEHLETTTVVLVK